jgi:class 3 adenylate cyclase
MRSDLRFFFIVLCVALSLACTAQWDRGEEEKVFMIDRYDLLDRTTEVPGVGREVPGINLIKKCTPRCTSGDDSLYAARDFADKSWTEPETKADSAAPPGRIHWMRLHMRLDPELKDQPLFLDVACKSDVDVYVNGEEVLRSNSSAAKRPADGTLDGAPPRFAVPVAFASNDGKEIIAVRMDLGAGNSGPRPELRMTLHDRRIDGIVQQGNLHAGSFIGINLIIFLLAIILWSFDRTDHNWLLLACITIITAFTSFTFAAGNWDIGMGRTTHSVMDIAAEALRFWPLYLLILLLRRLLGMERWKRTKFYATAMILVTLGIIVGGITGAIELGDDEVEGSGLTVVLVVVIGIGAVIVGVALVGLFIQVVRLGIRLLRSKGYVRWIGAGALFSSLSSVFFGGIISIAHLPKTSWLNTVSDYFNYVGLTVSAAVFMAIRSAHQNKAVARQRDDLDREVHERTAELRQERDRSDELLLNILPQEVAEELKRTGAAAAKHFDQASVLFTDFKGFTIMSEKVGASELLQELNTCFKAFDDIIGARGIEKIKTIGDAYMCAGGLPDPKSSSPADVVFAALEMQAFMEERRIEREAQGKLAFVMRVGIHTGPVVAGIVGVKKFQYDIWGDTVNTASRMESSGEVGQVNISANTYALVKDIPGLAFTPRGKIQAKGKGEMEMYFVGRV